ncbi:hypothetical protein BT69DRAFT_1337018 [Atractiella rhizophila]|nr:hypothetical protein BT69DRAFT_1337018 [Atractiella rhizophila]
MESFPLPYLDTTVHLMLIRNVSNAPMLLKRIRAASTNKTPEGEREREAVNFCFLDAAMITSKLHALTAAQQAILAERSAEGMKSKYVHGEVMWYLHPGNNIGEALRTFGLSPSSKDALVLNISHSSTPEDVREKALKVIDGEFVDGELRLDGVKRDWEKIRELYKIDDASMNEEAVDIVACSMAASKMVLL